MTVVEPIDHHTLFETASARMVILSTYAFDPSFFEGNLLTSRALRASRHIMVLVDGWRYTDLLLNRRPARRLNQRYLVLPVYPAKGVFHPKLHLLLGDRRASVICGSANLTQSGCTYNLELINRLTVSTDDLRSNGDQAHVVKAAFEFFRRQLTATKETRTREIANDWLDEATAEFPELIVGEGGRKSSRQIELICSDDTTPWQWLVRRVREEAADETCRCLALL